MLMPANGGSTSAALNDDWLNSKLEFIVSVKGLAKLRQLLLNLIF